MQKLKLNLVQKTMFIIVLNVVLPMIFGLAIRGLTNAENISGQEVVLDNTVIQSIENNIHNIESEMQGRVESTAALLNNISQYTFQPKIRDSAVTDTTGPSDTGGDAQAKMLHEIVSADAYRETDFFGIANLNSEDLELNVGEFSKSTNVVELIKSNLKMKALLKELSRELALNSGATTGVFRMDGFAIAYAAIGANTSAENFPSVYFIARKIDERFVDTLDNGLPASLTLMSQQDWEQALARAEVSEGQRSERDRVYYSLKDNQGTSVVWLMFEGSEVRSPIVFGLPVVVFIVLGIVLWVYTFRALSNQLIIPIIRLANHLRRVRTTNDYSHRLNHRSNDDMERLFDECNALVSHVESYTAELKISSYSDGLTNIGNQRLFSEKLETYWSLANRHQKMLCAIHFDVDYFKQYNDHFGHQQGDELLQFIAEEMTKVFSRESDVVARVGGDEFAILLYDISADTAHALAISLQNKIAGSELSHPGSYVNSGSQNIDKPKSIVTVSGGVSAIIPDGKIQADDLVRRSDQALYRAKAAGRNCVELFNHS